MIARIRFYQMITHNRFCEASYTRVAARHMRSDRGFKLTHKLPLKGISVMQKRARRAAEEVK